MFRHIGTLSFALFLSCAVTVYGQEWKEVETTRGLVLIKPNQGETVLAVLKSAVETMEAQSAAAAASDPHANVFRGRWKIVKSLTSTETTNGGTILSFEQNTMKLIVNDSRTVTFRVARKPNMAPAEIDMFFEIGGNVVQQKGIYEVVEKSLRIRFARADQQRPVAFDSELATGERDWLLQRLK